MAGKAGLRERNKREKLERILTAAREAFDRNGYEATNLRHVAAAANVAVGTLFLYAPTKEDLLVSVFRREIEPLVEDAFDTITDADIQDKLPSTFKAIGRVYADNLALSRPFLREMMFISGDQRAGVIEFMERWRIRVEDLLESAKTDGQLNPQADPSLLGLCSMYLFISGLREWVSGNSTQEKFEADLPMKFGALLTGFVTTPKS